ncbi:hypothetical protein SUGI_0864530 [Cryptomeria japonica]|nr:hypothetical protein SUGI_0864530 [Cryptomeria japonica]
MLVVTKEAFSRWIIVPEPLAGRPPATNKITHKILAVGKGRAEEETEQPRANSSSRHEMQNPATVHITDAERKKWEAMSCSSPTQLTHLDMLSSTDPTERFCSTPHMVAWFSVSDTKLLGKWQCYLYHDFGLMQREATMCSSAYIAPGSSRLDVVQQFTDLIGHTTAMPYWASGMTCRTQQEFI